MKIIGQETIERIKYKYESIDEKERHQSLLTFQGYSVILREFMTVTYERLKPSYDEDELLPKMDKKETVVVKEEEFDFIPGTTTFKEVIIYYRHGSNKVFGRITYCPETKSFVMMTVPEERRIQNVIMPIYRMEEFFSTTGETYSEWQDKRNAEKEGEQNE